MSGLSSVPGSRPSLLLLFCSGKKSGGISCQRAVLTSFVLQFLSYRPRMQFAHLYRQEGYHRFPQTLGMASKNSARGACLFFYSVWIGSTPSICWVHAHLLSACLSLSCPASVSTTAASALSLCSRDKQRAGGTSAVSTWSSNVCGCRQVPREVYLKERRWRSQRCLFLSPALWGTGCVIFGKFWS